MCRTIAEVAGVDEKDILYFSPSNQALAHLPYCIALDKCAPWTTYQSKFQEVPGQKVSIASKIALSLVRRLGRVCLYRGTFEDWSLSSSSPMVVRCAQAIVFRSCCVGMCLPQDNHMEDSCQICKCKGCSVPGLFVLLRS